MKKEIIARGAITALLTPLKREGLNLDAFETLIVHQLKNGISGLLLYGTTGEPLSITDLQKKVLYTALKEINGNRVPVICGISDILTENCIRKAKLYQKYGANALMLVTPYYYKANDYGIYKHFKAVCDAVKLPVIVYNVPARTNYDLSEKSELLKAVADIPNVVAIKHAQSNKEKMCEFTKKAPLFVYSGCDENNTECLASGGIGCISVASNLYPKEISDTCKAIAERDAETANRLNERLAPLFKLLSSEPNPAPAKYALSVLLKNEYGEVDYMKLPLHPISENLKNKIDEYIKNSGGYIK